MNIELINISIVIPCGNGDGDPDLIVSKILTSKHKPAEIIIVRSDIKSRHGNQFNHETTINSRLVGQTLVKTISIKGRRLYPGEARNQGIEASSNTLIGFLDTKTLPNDDWLKKSTSLLATQKKGILLGKTQYIAKSKAEQLFIDCTYGRKSLETIP